MPLPLRSPHPETLQPGQKYLYHLPPGSPDEAACRVVTLLTQSPCPAVVIVADERHRRFPVDRRSLSVIRDPIR